MKEYYINWLNNYMKSKYYTSTMDLIYYKDDDKMYRYLANLEALYKEIDDYAASQNQFPHETATTAFYTIKYHEGILKIGMMAARQPIYYCLLVTDKVAKCDFDYETIMKQAQYTKKLTK